MSVINQMLKDLDKRNVEQEHSASGVVVVTKKPSTLTIVFISVLVILALNGMGLYVWQLVSENQSLKAKAQTQAKQARAQKAAPVNFIEKQTATLTEKTSSIVVAKVQPMDASTEQIASIVSKKSTQIRGQAERPSQTNQANTEKAKTVAIQPKIKVKSEAKKTANLESYKVPVTKPAGKMSVSRRHLSEDELVAQKTAKAEKALNREQIAKAEQLFEEVLILQPSNAQVRQKLAALWFGRKAYQQASNLLSQGIAMAPKDSELRVMKAKIERQQNNYKAAYRTLKPLSTLSQQEYQVLLANTAQQANQLSGAVKAYNMLIEMQPDSAKWSLGLAIIYDKNSQFHLATTQYQLALNKGDLSASSATFAQQRIQALTE